MNRQEIFIVIMLCAALAGWFYHQHKQNQIRVAAARELAAQNATNTPAVKLSDEAQGTAVFQSATKQVAPVIAPVSDITEASGEAQKPAEAESGIPEQTITLSNDKMQLTLSSKGGVVRGATLFNYRSTVEKESSPIELDFSAAPALALTDLPGFGVHSDYDITPAADQKSATLTRRHAELGLTLEREITLLPDYQVAVRDRLVNNSSSAYALPASGIVIGAMYNSSGRSRFDTLGVDTLSATRTTRGRYGKVHHWGMRLNKLFTGGIGGGCGGAPTAEGLPLVAQTRVNEPQAWMAIKSRFFVQVFNAEGTNTGYSVAVKRLDEPGKLQLDYVSGMMHFPATGIGSDGGVLERNYSLYVGPKKLALLRRLAPKSAEIMQFGAFKWLCVLLVPTLNFFYSLIPSYGIAIILLTILVRMIFWPLTHKSSESMKRMQALQPKIKEVQAQFKDDPHKLQQETMKLYQVNKVNPLSSCLPMLIQIPVFIALFTVLRSAVELRFAPFLWIADLSGPENLIPGVLPIVPALNILPIFMAGTMLMQSKLTPAMGDPNQQKMMMWMMPAMMLFMFYSMPSALVLYWTVSQLLAIVQLVWQKRRSAARERDGNASGPGAGEVQMTRQARRRLAR